MSRFIGDYKDFRRPGEPRPLLVTRDLLEELGVKDSPREEQEQAVGAWLRDNRPPAVLEASLRADGFLADQAADEAGVVSNIRQTNRAKRARTGTDDRTANPGLTSTDAHQTGPRRTPPSNS